MKVQGKVWDGNERMSHRVVIQSLKEYVFGEWRMRIDAPKKILTLYQQSTSASDFGLLVERKSKALSFSQQWC